MTNQEWGYFPNFKPLEFACPCGCGKGADLDIALLFILQNLRNKYGAVTVTSGSRCQTYNDKLEGSIKNSDHTKDKAADFKCQKTASLAGRKEIMQMARLMPGFKYAYCNGYILYANGTSKAYSAKWMGNAVHISLK